MIQTRNLTFSYTPELFFNFPDIGCRAGETLLITGNSGKGKTTLLHLLGGLLRPESGSIRLDGIPLEILTEKKLDHFRGKNIGMVLQQSHFIASLTVLENVVLASWLAQGQKAVARAQFLLEHLNIADQMHKLPSRLSIGQQQRVAIARALINEPKMLLADEPTSSLDDQNAAIVAGLLSDLAQESGTALLVVTHDQRLKNIFSNILSL